VQDSTLEGTTEQTPTSHRHIYGKKYWREFKELFDDLTFSQNGQFLVARDPRRVVVFTDHFTARSMNNKFDEVVSLIQRDG